MTIAEFFQYIREFGDCFYSVELTDTTTGKIYELKEKQPTEEKESTEFTSLEPTEEEQVSGGSTVPLSPSLLAYTGSIYQ